MEKVLDWRSAIRGSKDDRFSKLKWIILRNVNFVSFKQIDKDWNILIN